MQSKVGKWVGNSLFMGGFGGQGEWVIRSLGKER